MLGGVYLDFAQTLAMYSRPSILKPLEYFKLANQIHRVVKSNAMFSRQRVPTILSFPYTSEASLCQI